MAVFLYRGYYFSTDNGQTFTPAINTNIGTPSPYTANNLNIGFYQIAVADQNGCLKFFRTYFKWP